MRNKETTLRGLIGINPLLISINLRPSLHRLNKSVINPNNIINPFNLINLLSPDKCAVV